MYDRTWARQVYEQYAKLCTRAQQIDACIQQELNILTGRKPARFEIISVLIDSIQGKSSSRLWTEYKRLVKKTPLDKDKLKLVSSLFRAAFGDEIRQMELEFA